MRVLDFSELVMTSHYLSQKGQDLWEDDRHRMLDVGQRRRVLVVALLPDVERLEQRGHQLQVEDGLGFALLVALDSV